LKYFHDNLFEISPLTAIQKSIHLEDNEKATQICKTLNFEQSIVNIEPKDISYLSEITWNLEDFLNIS